MKKINGFENVQALTDSVKLPAGGYEAKIMNAKVTEKKRSDGSTYEVLEIAVDITAGEFAGYYQKQYNGSTLPDKKWKGVARYNIPIEDGSDKDNLTQRILRSMVDAVEESNAGYHWDWDETKLKGKVCGILVRDKEYNFNGRHGFAPEIFKLVSTQSIRDGSFKTPEPKYLNGNAPTESATSSAASFVDDIDF